MDKVSFFSAVTRELLDTLTTDNTQAEEALLAELILRYRGGGRVAVYGLGRAGLACRAFAMRLAHLGFSVCFLGEPTTTALTSADILIIGSGSGATETARVLAMRAKEKIGVKTAVITAHPQSPLGRKMDITLPLLARDLPTVDVTLPSIQIMGNRFEQALWIYCDYLVMVLQARLGILTDEMLARHSNME